LYTETPLHCGAEAGRGFVDLPVQRERHSGFPVIPGSTIKGVLRDETDNEWGGKRDVYFGAPNGPNNDTVPGTISFSDGFLAAFPVRTTKVPFVWVSCPMVLERVYRAFGEALPAGVDALKSGEGLSALGGDILLEDLVVTLQKPKAAVNDFVAEHLLPDVPAFAYTRAIFRDRFVIVSDQDFQWLVESGTEVVTRIQLSRETGTTSGPGGNMFNEELVPRDTLFFSVLRELPQRESKFPVENIPDTIRLGGDETIGRGITWVRRARKA
jgi:CRISPR-associated protein Cmr4